MYPEFFTWLFQSTLPVRGATMPVMAIRSLALFQSTLPVRGATKLIKEQGIMEIFQSTLPVRGATGPPASCLWSSRYFNPRSPYGERPMALNCLMYPSLFQSTLPVRGATPALIPGVLVLQISIHAPRTGSDASLLRFCRSSWHFNPRSPYGERRAQSGMMVNAPEFQSTLPVRGATQIAAGRRPLGQFQSTLPVRGATGHVREFTFNNEFQSTLPVRGATFSFR